jgi:hypothetical protein
VKKGNQGRRKEKPAWQNIQRQTRRALPVPGKSGSPLLKEENELTHRSNELARQRQQLPWVRISKEYHFDTDDGIATLPDLFSGRSQLLVYRFMFGPEWKAGCPSCSRLRTRSMARSFTSRTMT